MPVFNSSLEKAAVGHKAMSIRMLLCVGNELDRQVMSLTHTFYYHLIVLADAQNCSGAHFVLICWESSYITLFVIAMF